MKKINMIRAVMYTCVAVLILNIVNIAHMSIKAQQDKVLATEEDVHDTLIPEYSIMQASVIMNEMKVQATRDVNIATIECNDLERSMLANPMVSIDGVSMKTNSGVHIVTDTISVDADTLLELFYTNDDSPMWDDENKINTLRVLWNFLVEQQGIPETNAAGLLGNIYEEGEFAEQQGTDLYISNIEQARTLLGSGKVGYGCAQWTYSARQNSLLEYYELAYKLYPDDWDKVRIIAECCMLLEECKAYGVFNDIYSPTSIEDATGRVAMKYETYSGCESQWSKINGSYKVATQSGTGYKRLCYAYDIYKYFTE
jgi:hypothetical protein